MQILTPIPIELTKVPLGLILMMNPMQSYYENYLTFHFIGTDIDFKLGAALLEWE